jgi:hypothetical protein
MVVRPRVYRLLLIVTVALVPGPACVVVAQVNTKVYGRFERHEHRHPAGQRLGIPFGRDTAVGQREVCATPTVSRQGKGDNSATQVLGTAGRGSSSRVLAEFAALAVVSLPEAGNQGKWLYDARPSRQAFSGQRICLQIIAEMDGENGRRFGQEWNRAEQGQPPPPEAWRWLQ